MTDDGSALPPPKESGRVRRGRVPFAVIVLLGLLACGTINIIPDARVWLPVKLAGATYGVLLLPGAVILRILGWPRSPASALAACAAWSVAALAPGLVLVFVLDRGIEVAIVWLVAVIAIGLVLGRGRPVEMEIRVTGLLLWVVGSVAVFGVLLWAGSFNVVGDAIEHVARMRKLTELDPPRSLSEINILPPSTGLHPGYAFPLWHAVGAVVVWISGLEETIAFRHWPTFLLPFAAAAIYRAGRSMFGSRAAGAATWVAYAALFAFPYAGVGYFNRLSYPGYMSIFVFWPLVVDRVFTYLQEGGREPVWTVAAASLVVAAMHPSYVPFMMMVIGAFLVARTIVTRCRGDLARLAVMFAAVSLPFLLFLIWLYPIASSAGTTVPRDSFATLLDRTGDRARIKPEVVTRGGASYIAALLLVPVASLATRTRAAAFIAGSSAVVVLTLVVSWFFTPFADVMSISQGRRFLFYLPWAFALTGGALVLARFRYIAVVGAFIVGAVLQSLYPGDFSYRLTDPGPGWVAWFAAGGALIVLAAGAAGKVHVPYSGGWAVPIVIAFSLPVAFAGLSNLKTDMRSPGFGEGLLAAVQQSVERDDVVLSDPRTAYRLTARAPVYIAAAQKGHGGDTFVNRHEERRIDAAKFFNAALPADEAAEIVSRWDVQWILVHKDNPYPRAFVEQLTPVYDGATYALYPVDPAVSPPGE